MGADHLLPEMEADTLIADKAFDADARVLEPLASEPAELSAIRGLTLGSWLPHGSAPADLGPVLN